MSTQLQDRTAVPASRPPAAPPRITTTAEGRSSSWAGPRVVGAALLAIGVVALLAAAAIPAARDGWGMSGPRFFPLLASVALIVSSLAFLVRTFVRPDQQLLAHAAEEAEQTDWKVTGLVAASLVAYVALFETLGYIVSTAIFFPLAARVLGSRDPVRDIAAGVWLAVGIAFVFTQLLAVRLPSGLLGF
jgi:putative tricarboxylic transport membrane protein